MSLKFKGGDIVYSRAFNFIFLVEPTTYKDKYILTDLLQLQTQDPDHIDSFFTFTFLDHHFVKVGKLALTLYLDVVDSEIIQPEED